MARALAPPQRRDETARRVLVGSSDAQLARAIGAILDGSERYSLADTALDADTVLREISSQRDISAVVLDADLARVLAPAIGRRLGTIVVDAKPSFEDLRSALSSRVIDVLASPVSPEALETALVDAVARTESYPEPPGMVFVVTGAKGGCGSTTLTVHLADHARRRGKTVCIVELGPPAGGVGALLHDSAGRTSVAELLADGDGSSEEQVSAALGPDGAELGVLVGPVSENGTPPDRSALAKLLWRLETVYDVVLVDAGVTVPPAVAAGMGRRALLVVNPAWACIAAANALVHGMNGNHDAPTVGPLVVINRSDQADGLNPSQIRKRVRARTASTSLPACFGDHQRAAREGMPAALRNLEWGRAVADLASEIGLDA